MTRAPQRNLRCCIALALALAFTATPAAATQSTTINGNENIVVSGTSGNVAISINRSTNNTQNTFVYNTKNGLSEQEVLDLTKAAAQQTQDRSKAFFNSLSRGLDQLGKKLSKEITAVAKTQAELQAGQTELRQLVANNGDGIEEMQERVDALTAAVAEAEEARKAAAAEQIGAIAAATAEAVVDLLRQAATAEAEAERQRRRSLTDLLTFGLEWSGFGRSNHGLAEVDYRRAIWPSSSNWALEGGLRVLLGSQSRASRYVDGDGRTLNEPPVSRDVAYGAQLELGVRGNRGGRVGVPVAVAWRAWSAGHVGHWAAVGEAGLEYRDSFTVGAAVVGTLELTSPESHLRYTGVGAASRALPREAEPFLGGRAYVGHAF